MWKKGQRTMQVIAAALNNYWLHLEKGRTIVYRRMYRLQGLKQMDSHIGDAKGVGNVGAVSKVPASSAVVGGIDCTCIGLGGAYAMRLVKVESMVAHHCWNPQVRMEDKCERHSTTSPCFWIDILAFSLVRRAFS